MNKLGMSSRNRLAFRYSPHAEVSIEELYEMTIEKLGQFALSSQHPDGVFRLPVKDWSHWTGDREKCRGRPHEFIESVE